MEIQRANHLIQIVSCTSCKDVDCDSKAYDHTTNYQTG